MCFVFHKSEHFVKKIITNPYVRIFAGAVVIIGLTWAIGDMRYNGAGMDMAIRAIEGEADWYDFLLKMLFTAVTLSAGFKGGEIVPTFCIGATFGCVFGGLIGIEPGFAAALALAGIFCCATASPLSAVVLAVEMFGIAILPYSIPVCIIAWLLSCKEGLFYGRFFASPVFNRIKTKVKAK
jgi:H+/Cl- antiporter ClcA